MIVTSAFKTETDLRHKPVQQRPTWSKTHMWLFLCCSELNISTTLTDSERENAEEKEIKREKSEDVIKERWIKPDRSTHNLREKEHLRRKRTEGEKTVSLNLLTATRNSVRNSFYSCNKMSKIKLKQNFHKSFTKSRGTQNSLQLLCEEAKRANASVWVCECARELTGAVGKAKGDRAIRNITHVPYRHLTGVISKVLWTEVFQFQHLCLTLQTHTNIHNVNIYHIKISSVRQSMHLNIMKTNKVCWSSFGNSAICALIIFFFYNFTTEF